MTQLEIVGILLMVVGDLGPILAGIIIRMSTASQSAVEGSLIPEPVFLVSLGTLVGGAILFVLAGERAAEKAESEDEEVEGTLPQAQTEEVDTESDSGD